MQWHREEYLALMTFGEAPRPMFVELFGPLIGLEEEWRAQGASAEEIDLTAFDWDWIPVVGGGANTGLRGGCEPADVEETDEYIIRRDRYGRTTKLCKGMATIPLPQDHPVHGPADWETVKPWFEWHDDRVDPDAVAAARRRREEEGALVCVHIPGGYDLPRQLMGEELACLAYYEEPEMMRDLLQTVGDTAVEAITRLGEKLTIDQLSVHEDLAGKSGPLVGPAQIEEFIGPYYRRCWEAARAAGATIFSQDSDGNVAPVIDAFLDAGLNHMYPMEPAAGMDIVRVREQYGRRLSLRGGIDKHVLRQDKAAIRRELDYKLQPLLRNGGGVAFGLDHRIPNGTPLENYRYYVDLGREILGLPPRGEGAGWARMAF